MHINDLFTGSGGSLPTKNETPGAGSTEGLTYPTDSQDLKTTLRRVAIGAAVAPLPYLVLLALVEVFA